MDTVSDSAITRGQFFRNAGKGGIVLATSGGVLATVTSSAFAFGSPTTSDVETLRAACTAEVQAARPRERRCGTAARRGFRGR
ncbi:MAG TPA: hypothetical protein VFW38_12005 [Solirubrobacteraceae bacterium]|nr:hypothetical protein [Solirubrobacteraceae bacterium]